MLHSFPYRLFRQGLSTLPRKTSAVIVSYARTPIGTFGGSFADLSATELGSIAVKAALEKIGIDKKDIQEAFLGNVISAGIGQAPCRQAILKAGLPVTIPCTTINKVCASGMKAIALAAQSIELGHHDIVISGGFESMSNVPYYLPKARKGYRLGDQKVIDGVIFDGLWDPYNDQHMGMCGEACAKEFGFSREAQDKYAIESYNRAIKASSEGKFKEEIVQVTIQAKRGGSAKTYLEDEEMYNMNLDKIHTLRPAFKKDGTVTAGNASPLNDGAAALVLMSEKKAELLGIRPLGRIISFADAAKKPIEFTTAPSLAIQNALNKTNLTLKDIEYHEINEAFSVVSLANMEILKLSHDIINVNGGAVALGHPIGMSGSRIVGHLCHVLKQKDATIGCASICNGGGGASAIIIERLH